jgi:hypothetical protein
MQTLFEAQAGYLLGKLSFGVYMLAIFPNGNMASR